MSLSDALLRSLKPRDKRYEIADQHGLFAEVMPSGVIAFRYRYWIGKQKQKVTVGTYPRTSLKEARRLHSEFRTSVASGKSPAHEKQRERRARLDAETFREFADYWMKQNPHSERWMENQRFWLNLDIYPAIGSRKLADVTPSEVLNLLDSIKKRGAPQSALRVRGIIKQVFDFAIGRQRATFNPATQIPSKIIHRPQSRERTLTVPEIRMFLETLKACGAHESNKLAFRLILLTLVRKGELRFARWEHVNIDQAEWTIPQTKNGKPHVVYLSKQAIALFVSLKGLAGDSEWVMPSLYDPCKPTGQATLNFILYAMEFSALRAKTPWHRFTPHDLRRTASTLLHEHGFNTDVIEKALNHTMRGVRGIYNRAQYSEQRRSMLQYWADFIDSIERSAEVIPLRRTG